MKYKIKAGTLDQEPIFIYLQNPTTGDPAVQVSYSNVGLGAVSSDGNVLWDTFQSTGTSGVWSELTWLEVSEARLPGVYQICLPSSFFTTPGGAIKHHVIVQVRDGDDGTGGRFRPVLLEFEQDTIDYRSSAYTKLETSAGEIYTGVATASGTITSVQTDLTTTDDDHWVGRVMIFTSGGLKGQATSITDSTSAGLLTFRAVSSAVPDEQEFIIV